MTFVSRPPPDWHDCEVQCARCGSSMLAEDCSTCGGNGWIAEDEDGETDETCDECEGTGTVFCCMASPEWCAAHPLPGREQVTGGEQEWFRQGEI